MSNGEESHRHMERSVSSQSAHTIHLDFRHKFLFSQKLRDLAVEDVPHFYILPNLQEIMNWHNHCVGKTVLKMRSKNPVGCDSWIAYDSLEGYSNCTPKVQFHIVITQKMGIFTPSIPFNI